MSVMKSNAHVSIAVILVVVIFTAVTSWYASKRFYDYQESLKRNEQFWKTMTVSLITIGTIIGTTKPIRSIWRRLMRTDYARYPSYPLHAGPKERARDANMPH